MPGGRQKQQQSPGGHLEDTDGDEVQQPHTGSAKPASPARRQSRAPATYSPGRTASSLNSVKRPQPVMVDEHKRSDKEDHAKSEHEQQPLMLKRCSSPPSDDAVYHHRACKPAHKLQPCSVQAAAASALRTAACLQQQPALGNHTVQQDILSPLPESQLNRPVQTMELCRKGASIQLVIKSNVSEQQQLLPSRKHHLQDGDDDGQDSWLERLSAHPAVVRISRRIDRIMQSQAVAVLFDISDVLLFALDMYTDARVVQAMSDAGYYGWMTANLVFMTWHFILMAVLMSMYARRTTQTWTACGVSSEVFKAGLWVLAIPLALPVVVVLDILMLFTSTAPVFFPHFFASFSSFMANYNFTRLFLEFLFESLPQTILQTYIYYHLLDISNETSTGGIVNNTTAIEVSVGMAPILASPTHQADRHTTVLSTSERAKQAVVASLVISSLNTCKFAFKLWKAAGDAGLRMHQYLKYLLLLKGNYECPPATMAAVVRQCCTYKEGVFTMNGLPLHREKARYGPAQQAYILLSAFQRCPTRKGVTRWVCAGCPLASINRILEQGIKSFRNLEALELAECAVRGDTLPVVLRAIKKHAHLVKVKMVQTGILSKYRNTQRDEWAQLLKPSCGLTHFAVCAAWWGEAAMVAAAQHVVDHPCLQSLAIEFPVLQHIEEEEGMKSGLIANKHFKGIGAALQLTRQAGQAGNMVGAAAGGAALAVAAVGGALTAATDLVMSTSSSLKRLVGLSHKQRGPLVTAAYMSAAACMLRGAPALTSLALHRHILNQDGCALLAAALQQAGSRLTSLSLSGSSLGGDIGAAALAKALAKAPAITQVCLRGCGLSGDGLAGLLTGLLEAGRVKDLDISANRINDAALEAAARLLRLSTHLNQLQLEEWGDALQQADRHAAIPALFDGIAASHSLQQLSLAGTGLGQRGMAGLIAALGSGSCSLCGLDLSQVEKASVALLLPDACWLPLAHALPAAASLTSLNLAGNPLSASGCAALADVLPQCSSLTNINLSRTAISDMQLAVLAEGLQAMPALQSLSLSGVGPLQVRGVQALAQLLQPLQAPVTNAIRPQAPDARQPPGCAVEQAEHDWAIPTAGHPANQGCGHDRAGLTVKGAAEGCLLKHLDLSFVDFGGLRSGGAGLPDSRGGSHILTSLPSPTSQTCIPAMLLRDQQQTPHRIRLSSPGLAHAAHDSGAPGTAPASPRIRPSPSTARLLSDPGAADATVWPARPDPEHLAVEGLIQILAAAVARSSHLEHLSLAHCALPDAAVWSLGAAVSKQGGALHSLDLSGCSESVVRPAFSLVLGAHSSSQQHGMQPTEALQCLKCTAGDGSYTIVDLLACSMAL